MLGNCEKMVVISSTTNDWPEGYGETRPRAASLKCPRCDSSNTSSATTTTTACLSLGTSARPVSVTGLEIDLSASSNHVTPLFYGLPSNPSELNLPFPRFNSRASNEDTVSGYDLQPQLGALGLGFSSGIIANDTRTDDYRNGFNPAKQIQDLVTSSSLLSNYSIFGSSSSTTTPTMASLINSSLQQQKFMNGDLKESRGANHFQPLVPYEDLQISGNTSMAMKEVKSEHGHNTLEWNSVPCQNQIEQIGSSDPSLYWNLTSLGAWSDLPNMGSSVTSLI
ncbi:hypothetical protein CK203_025784 [Vitis vinifera]|uniref:Uncharacterized protein n=1 Tax=Vitis vinifera TaxID=29760 RepID=A0A438IGN5_VITVI|nr:hypothetical protein CK203_025784 [Vitis vinifera]